MIPPEIARIADLIWPNWDALDDDVSRDVLQAAYRVWNAGYRPMAAAASEQS